MVRDVALQRLHELDPGEANDRILAEIRQPHLDAGRFLVSGKTLGMLPNKTLPELDQLLATRLEDKNSRTRGLDAQLIGRYSTETIAPRVKAVYENTPGPHECIFEDGLISYFLHVAGDYGVEKMGRANPYCLTESLKRIVEMKRWSDVQPALIETLNGTNLSMARSAAETLAKYGDADAEKAMWERLRAFHQQWVGREKEFQQAPNRSRDVSDAEGFQFGLVESLGKAQAWLLDNDQLDELERLTVGQERENVARWHWHSPVDLGVNVTSENQFQATIGQQYFLNDVASLKAKLMQYPGGTRFWMNTFGPEEQLTLVVQAINEAALEKALIVDSAPKN